MEVVDTLIFSKDLLFTSRIKDVARQSGRTPKVQRAVDGLCEALSSVSQDARAVVLVDLDKPSVALELIANALSQIEPDSSNVVCFFSHVHLALAEKAKALGFQTVIPRSKFVQMLPQILLP